jgi:phage tail-like protein
MSPSNGATHQPTLPPLAVDDQLANFRFWVEMQSVIEGVFLECSGLSMERDVLSYKEGGRNDRIHLLPGRTKYPNIVLKRGLALSANLWNWYQEGLYNCLVRRISFSILVFNSENSQVKSWDILDAFPVKWSGPELKTDSNQVAIETLEIAHHGLRLSPQATR